MSMEYRDEALCLDKLDIGVQYESIEDPEERTEIKTDADGKILSYRDKEGVFHEDVGVESERIDTNHLNLSPSGMYEFQQALKDSGFNPGGAGDFSDTEKVELPEPKHYGLLNLIVNSLPVEDNDFSEGYAEYYDFHGNYWKKPIELTAQGQSSRWFARDGGKGNYTLDIVDGSEIKFGSWVPQDSFHLKGNYKDVTRCILPTSYKWAYKFMNYLNAKPNRVLMNEEPITTTKATGDRFTDWPSDARCLPDGFPCEVYINGEYWGLYSWQLKKHRKNYSMDKSDYTSFFIDAEEMMADGYQHGIWNDGPDAIKPGTIATKWWKLFDIKGPKDLICMDGTKFDGDHPKELIDSTSEFYDATNKKHKGSQTTKNLIRAFQTRYLEVKELIVNNSIEEAKTKFNEYFDYNACMLVYIFNCLMKNTDSVKKNTLWAMYKSGKIAPMLWDLDGMYGEGAIGYTATNPSAYLWNTSYAQAEWPLGLFWSLYENEIKSMYANLRRENIISIDTWHSIVFGWINRVGEDAYNRDIKKWPETPSYRENFTNTEYWIEVNLIGGGIGNYQLWDENTSYNTNDEVVLSADKFENHYMVYKAVQPNLGECPVSDFYSKYPFVGGYYNSPKRMEKWIIEQIRLCDNILNYSEY